MVVEPKADALATLISLLDPSRLDSVKIKKDNGMTFFLNQWFLDTDSDSVDALLSLSDQYDFAIIRQKCVEFLIGCTDDPFFQLRISDKHELVDVEVKIQIFWIIGI